MMLNFWIAAAALCGRAAAASSGLLSTPFLVARNGSYGLANGSSGILPCDALIQAGLGDRVLFATDPEYEPQIQSWYAKNNRLRPYCLVLPQNTKEVSTALTALVNANDGAGDWHIAVRSGGHGTTGNNIANGVTIDLTMMNSSSYDPETNLAKIEPGGRWRNVYADLEKQGVTVTGGRDGDVGVGGFLLGGGNSFFSGRMGFGCDSVVNYEVVLGNGTIVNANNETNADLWRALKGGSSNFGIVTRYDMEALPARDLLYDLRYLSSNYSETVIEAVAGFADQNQSLADNHLITFYMYNASITPDIFIGTIKVNTKGNGNESTTFDQVKKLPAFYNVTVLQSMAKAAAGSQLVSGYSGAGATLTFNNDPQILRYGVEVFQDFVETLKRSTDPTKVVGVLFFQPIPTYMAQISKQRGGNMLGLDAVDHNAIMWTGGVAIDPTLEDGGAALAIAQVEMSKMTAKIREFSKSVKGDIDFLYLNYADASQDSLGTYSAANIQHIRDVAAQYDPAEVFQKRIPGGFKISRVA